MEIAHSFMKDGQQWARIYRSIDPDSIKLQGGKIYFAHYGTRAHDTYSNHYCLPCAIGPDYITSDPVEIRKIQETIPGRDYGICVETFGPAE